MILGDCCLRNKKMRIETACAADQCAFVHPIIMGPDLIGKPMESLIFYG